MLLFLCLFTIYYNTTDTVWYIREAGGWSALTGHVDQTTVTPPLIQINYNSIQYRVTEGITFVKDEFTSYSSKVTRRNKM